MKAWKLVPVEPTEEMRRAVLRVTGHGSVVGTEVYHTAIAAAPELDDAAIERAVHAACAENHPFSYCLFSVKAQSGTTCGCSLPKGIRAAINAMSESTDE